MKIIKAGQIPEARQFRATCSRCQTLFEFAAGEAKFYSDQRDGDFYQIGCPLEGCGNKVSVDARRPMASVWRGISAEGKD